VLKEAESSGAFSTANEHELTRITETVPDRVSPIRVPSCSFAVPSSPSCFLPVFIQTHPAPFAFPSELSEFHLASSLPAPSQHTEIRLVTKGRLNLFALTTQKQSVIMFA
jgi:hypothetical protein